MGLFDSLVDRLQSLQSSDIAGPVLNELQQQGIGSISDLASKFQDSGFGEHVTSWISANAQNLPISSDDIQNVLGSSTIQNLASKFGMDTSQVSDLLAKHLPGIVGQAQS